MIKMVDRQGREHQIGTARRAVALERLGWVQIPDDERERIWQAYIQLQLAREVAAI
jgi:predicted Fe-S protein YdhL (DUF1289 family)